MKDRGRERTYELHIKRASALVCAGRAVAATAIPCSVELDRRCDSASQGWLRECWLIHSSSKPKIDAAFSTSFFLYFLFYFCSEFFRQQKLCEDCNGLRTSSRSSYNRTKKVLMQRELPSVTFRA